MTALIIVSRRTQDAVVLFSPRMERSRLYTLSLTVILGLRGTDLGGSWVPRYPLYGGESMKSDDSDAVDDSSAHSGGMFRRKRPWRLVTFRAKDDTSRPVPSPLRQNYTALPGRYAPTRQTSSATDQPSRCLRHEFGDVSMLDVDGIGSTSWTTPSTCAA